MIYRCSYNRPYLSPYSFSFIIFIFLFSACNDADLDTKSIKIHQGNSNYILYDIDTSDEQLRATGGDVWEHGIVASLVDEDNYSSSQIHTQSMFALDCNTELCVSVGNFGKILRTTDFEHWIEINNNSSQLLKGCLVSDDYIYALGGHGYTDGVIHRWNLDGTGQRTFNCDVELRDMELAFNGKLVAVGYGTILTSEDQGRIWKLQDVENDFYRAIAKSKKQELYVIGWAGTLLKSVDNGQTWERLSSNGLLESNARWLDIVITADDRIIIVGEKGYVSSWTTDGELLSESRLDSKIDLHGVTIWNDKIIASGAEESIYEIKF